MNYITDLELRISKIMKNEELMFNVGDIQRITGLKSTQIHYWEHCGYITSIRPSKNRTHLYSHSTLIKIEIIQSYLKSGFTLKMANHKASQGYRSSNLIRDLVLSRFRGLTKINGQPALDFGPLTIRQSRYELFFIMQSHKKANVKLINRKSR